MRVAYVFARKGRSVGGTELIFRQEPQPINSASSHVQHVYRTRLDQAGISIRQTYKHTNKHPYSINIEILGKNPCLYWLSPSLPPPPVAPSLSEDEKKD